MELRKRKLASGRVSFFIDDFHNGVRIRETLGVVIPHRADPMRVKSLTKLAHQLYDQRSAEILLARKGLIRDELWTLVSYAEKLAAGRAGDDPLVKSLPYMRSFFGTQEIHTLDYRACEAFQAFLGKTNLSPKARTAGLAPKTVKLYFNAFSFVLNEAMRDRILERNPATAVRRVRVPDKVTVSLTPAELASLWSTPAGSPFGEVVKRAFFLSVNTGLRFGDIRALVWGDIRTDSDGWKLVRAQNKTGNLITTPLNGAAVALLKPTLSLNPKAPCFPELQTGTNHGRYVPRWAKAAGLSKPCTFHLGRHTFGTLLAGLGTNALMIQHLMGHSSQKMTNLYTRSAGNEAKALLDSLPTVGAG